MVMPLNNLLNLLNVKRLPVSRGPMKGHELLVW